MALRYIVIGFPISKLYGPIAWNLLLGRHRSYLDRAIPTLSAQ